MKLKTKTLQDLLDAGFKRDFNGLYYGDKKRPDVLLKMIHMDHYLDKELEVVDYCEHDGKLEVIGKFGKAKLDYSLFVDGKKLIIDSNTIVKSPIIKGKNAKYYKLTDSFEFPCSFSDMNKSESIKLAKWILKVTK